MRSTIGIDISPLQNAHRMRGIGYVTRNVVARFIDQRPEDCKLVLFYDPNENITPKEIATSMQLSGFMHEFQPFIAAERTLSSQNAQLMSRLGRSLRSLLEFYRGSTTTSKSCSLDVFLQFDPEKPLPRTKRATKQFLFVHDLIPYVLEQDYLWSYKTARKNGRSRKRSLRFAVNRKVYILKMRANTRRASRLFANSDTTKHDFVRYVKTPENKITVTPLGIDESPLGKQKTPATVPRYYETSWGYFPESLAINDLGDYLLFVGGADPRRKLADVVTAFNQLRSRGEELKLVLAGDIMQGPNNIPDGPARQALLSSAYKEDIVYTGFISDRTRTYLYRNALAFVFPSVYEGFGLPVLESLQHGAPPICYPNRACLEVGGDLPYFAHEPMEIVRAVQLIKSMSGRDLSEARQKYIEHAKVYSWKVTASLMLSAMLSTRQGKST